MKSIFKFLMPIFQRFAEFLTMLFGQWTPPKWMAAIAQYLNGYLAKLFGKMATFKQSQPRKFWSITSVSMVLLAAGIYGIIWKLRQPPPLYTKIHIDVPEPQYYSKDSKPNPLYLNFSNPAAKLELAGKKLDKGVIMSPALPGQWVFENDTHLAFYPEKEWTPGQNYVVSLDSKILRKEITLASPKVNFSAKQFSITQSSGSFYQDPVDPNRRLMNYKLNFSHPVDRTLLEKSVSLIRKSRRSNDTENGDGKDKYSATYVYQPYDLSVFIQSENLTLPERDLELTLAIAKGVTSSLGGNALAESYVSGIAPSINSFLKVIDAKASFVSTETSRDLTPVLSVDLTTGVTQKDLLNHIEAYLLPAQKPKSNDKGEDAEEFSESPDEGGDHSKGVSRWTDSDVTDQVLKKSAKIKLTLHLPQETQPIPQIVFNHSVSENRALFLKIPRGLVAFGGYKLAEDWTKVVNIPKVPVQLEFMYPGSLVSLGGDRKVTILSRGVDIIKTNLYRIAPERINHLVAFNGGTFSKPEMYNGITAADIAEWFVDTHQSQSRNKLKADYYGLDFTPYLTAKTGVDGNGRKKGLFLVGLSATDEDTLQKNREQNIPEPNYSHYYNFKDKRFIIVTDLGVIEKKNQDGSRMIYVVELKSGRAASNVEVSLLARNGTSLISERTDGQGIARFKSMDGLSNEQEPVAWVAKRDDDLTFLPFSRDSTRLLSYSRFDVGGDYTVDARLDGYLFTDRGLYRPGEELTIASILKGPCLSEIPTDLPLEIVLTNPRGTETFKKRFTAGKYGFDEHHIQTEAEWLTGTYTATIRLLRDKQNYLEIASTTVKINEFLPDRLKMSLDYFSDKKSPLPDLADNAWIDPSDKFFKVKLENLFGGPAEGNRVVMKYSLRPDVPELKGYSDWTFKFDENTSLNVSEVQINEFETDKDGIVSGIIPDLGINSGFYRLSLIAEGFEKSGGRFVSRVANKIVGPTPYLVGYKPDGDLGWIEPHSKRTVQIIALNEKMQPIELKDLKAELIQTKYKSTLVTGHDGLSRYQSTSVEETISSTKLQLIPGPNSVELNTNEPGQFHVRLFNDSGSKVAEYSYSVRGEGKLNIALDRSNELKLKLNKQNYFPGEVAEIEIRGPYAGSGYITVETDHVLSSTWFSSPSPTSVQKITVPKGFSGSAYVNVLYFRSSQSREIYTKPLAYAAIPLYLNRSKFTSSVEISVPEVTKPDEEINATITLDRDMRLAFYAVDEGILQVAKYKNPEPLDYLFRKKALMVATRQILDLILPDHTLAMKAAAGGDQDGNINRNLNPFRRKSLPPAAFWSGIRDLHAGANQVSFRLPSHFNGSYRLIAVGVTDSTIGIKVSSARRVGPYVINPVLPLFVAPGDEFNGEVTISNQVQGSGPKNITVIKAIPPQGLEGGGEMELEIPEGKEKVATFKFKVGSQLQSTAVKFEVYQKLNPQIKVAYEESLSIRPGTPLTTDIDIKVVKDNSVEVPIDRALYKEFYEGNMSFSSMPMGLADGIIRFLQQYPYGCSEQVTSQAIAALVMLDETKIQMNKDKSKDFIRRAVNILRSRQRSDGTYGYWSNSNEVYETVNFWVGIYLTEMVERGLARPEDGLNDLLSYLNGYVESHSVNRGPEYAYPIATATYLLARNQRLSGQKVKDIKDAFEKNIPITKKFNWKAGTLGSYLAASLNLKGLQKEAQEIMNAADLKSPVGYNFSIPTFDYFGTAQRKVESAYVIAKHFPELVSKHLEDAHVTLVGNLQGYNFTTYTGAWSLLTLTTLSKSATAEMTDNNVKFVAVDEKGQSTDLPLTGQFVKSANIPFGTTKIKGTRTAGSTALYLSTATTGFDQEKSLKTIEKGLELVREYYINDSKANTARVGDEIDVYLKISSQSGINPHQVAIVDLLPGGTELQIDSIKDSNGNETSNGESSQGGRSEQDQIIEHEEAPEAPEMEEHPNDSEGFNWNPLSQLMDTAYAASKPFANLSAFAPSYIDAREDRIIYFGVPSGSARVMHYKIRATASGKFFVPPTFAHDMYNPGILYRGKGEHFTIEPKK
jgi:alpha-2-macroglobulin